MLAHHFQPPHSGCRLAYRRWCKPASALCRSGLGHRRSHRVAERACRAALGTEAAESPPAPAVTEEAAPAQRAARNSSQNRGPRTDRRAPLRPKIDQAQLAKGTKLEGTVRHVAPYGAFVDVGLPKDQLLHISEITENFVSDATTVIKVGEVVKPWVSDIKADGAIRLSLREPGSVRKPRPQSTSGPTRRPRLDASQVQAGNWFEGTAVSVLDYGLFVDFGWERQGLLHRRNISAEWIHDVREKFKEGDEVRVRILSVEPQPGGGQPRVALAATEEGTPEPRPPPREEQPLPGFVNKARLQTSDLKRGQEVEGVVANVADFGVFIDVGTPRHALLHQNQYKSENTDHFVKGQTVKAWVRSAHESGDKISLTQNAQIVAQLKEELVTGVSFETPSSAGPSEGRAERRNLRSNRGPVEPLGVEVGQELELPVESVRPYGVMLKLREGLTALLHRDEFGGNKLDADPLTSFTVGEQVQVRVINKDDRRRRVDVSQKTDEDREFDKRLASGTLTSGPVEAKPSKKGSAPVAAGGTFASALALAGISASPPKQAPAQAPVNGAHQPSSEDPVAALAPEASEEDSPPVITDEVTADVQHAAAEAAATEPEIASPSADAEIASPPVEPEIPSPPAELAPEPIDPQPVIEDVHQNLEPDVVAAGVGESSPPELDGPKPEPIDPAPLVDAVHENLEPDATPEPLTSLSPETLEESSPTATVDAGDAAVPATPSGASDVPSRKETVDAGDAAVPSASAVLPGTIDSPADPQTAKELLGKPDNSPLLPEAAQVPDAGPSGEQAAPGSNLGAVDLPPAQDPTQQSKPANVAKLADNGAISEAREEPVAKPSPALDLAGEAVPAAASPPTSQPADSLQAGANPLVGDTLLGDTPDLTKPAVPQPEPEALASSPSPTAVAEEEAGAPIAAPGAPPSPPAAVERVSVPSSSSNGVPASSASGAKVSASLVQELRRSSGAGMMDCKKALAQCEGDMAKASDFLRAKGLAKAGSKSGRVAAEGVIASYIHAGNRLGVILEVNCETDFVARNDKFRELVEDLSMEAAAMSDTKYVKFEDVPQSIINHEKEVEMGKEDILQKPEKFREQIVNGRVEKTVRSMCLLDQPFIKELTKSVDATIKESIAALGENISVRRFERYTLGEGIEKKTADLGAEVAAQTQALLEKAEAAKNEPKEELPEPDMENTTVKVDALAVKSLRQESGAGMMDCKKALVACDNNATAAADWLRKKGLASAGKKAGRVTSEGALWSYIHTGDRLGVMVEVNCETDFVARGEKFLELCEDLSMQIAACDASVVSVEDIPAEELERERQIELQKEDLASKPEKFRQQIVEGRVAKIAKERALLEAAFVRDTNKTVRQHIQEVVAAVGENIQVRRFVRYHLGEGIDKPHADIAADVAAQTAGAA